MTDIWKGKNGPLLIAEIGGNHEGDFEYAKKLTQLAIQSGCDYVKFQIYTGDGLVNPNESPDRNKHFKKFELSIDQHIELARMCKENKIGYLASVWEKSALNWVDEYMDFYKIGSGDLTAYPLLREICKRKKPIILSTGLAKEREVIETVSFIRSCHPFYEEPRTIALLQCTSMYPIPPQDANLNVMHSLKEQTGCPVGYSDHTEGVYALEIATALGAEILEFHFTDDREGKEFRDHKVSLTCQEVKQLILKIKEIGELVGESEKNPLDIEGNHITSFRRGVYPIRDLQKGEEIQESDLTILRPNHGIDARYFDKVVGKVASSDIKAFQKLDWSLFND